MEINKIKVQNVDFDIRDISATKTVELTQAEYDALATKDPNTLYIITDATGGDLSNYYTKDEIDDLLDEVESVAAAALNALNDNFGGLKLVKLTQAQYDALATKDANTLYIIV